MELYKISIEEYRFQIKFNWDRVRYYLTLNAALISAAAALLRLGANVSSHSVLFAAAVFGVGAWTSFAGFQTIKKGHEYYERSVWKKMLFEELLGLREPAEGFKGPLANLAVTTTRGMTELAEYTDSDEWMAKAARIQPGSINARLLDTMRVFSLLNLAGIAYTLHAFFEWPTWSFLVILYFLFALTANSPPWRGFVFGDQDYPAGDL